MKWARTSMWDAKTVLSVESIGEIRYSAMRVQRNEKKVKHQFGLQGVMGEHGRSN